MSGGKGKPRRSEEIYSDCERCLTGKRSYDDQVRHRCTVIHDHEWEPPDEVPAEYMGGPDGCAESNDDGCPGGWYRSEFFASFAKYRRGERGALHTSDDRLVLEAIEYYERESSRHLQAIE